VNTTSNIFDMPAIEGDIAPIAFHRRWYEIHGYRHGMLFAHLVDDDSMAPMLGQGDTVVVNTEDTQPTEGAVFVVNHEGGILIRRFASDGERWFLCPDNHDRKRYPNKAYDRTAKIIGRVVYRQSDRV
jgi:phage repressor protein C with HTH and peptisase S24 domain